MIVGVTVATRNISKLKDGMMVPWARISIGTRRIMPSRSVLIVNRPRPAAACFQNADITQQAGNSNMKGMGSSPQHSDAGHRKRAVEFRCHVGQRRFRPAPHASAASHPQKSDRCWAVRAIASRCFIEVAHRFGRVAGIEPVGFREHDVEGDHGGAELGQVGDQIRDVRPRPWPLSELGQALFVDIDNGDRPCGLDPRLDDLKRIEGPDPKLLDRRRDRRRAAPQARPGAQGRPASHSRTFARTSAAISSAASCRLDIRFGQFDHARSNGFSAPQALAQPPLLRSATPDAAWQQSPRPAGEFPRRPFGGRGRREPRSIKFSTKWRGRLQPVSRFSGGGGRL